MKKIKILIVDDNIVARSMLTRIFSDQEDMEVVGEFGSGVDGIIMMEAPYPDVIMLEAELSGEINLEETIKEIRSLSPETKIIICTNPNIQDIIISATNFGASDFISKPYKKDHILRIIRENVKTAALSL